MASLGAVPAPTIRVSRVFRVMLGLGLSSLCVLAFLAPALAQQKGDPDYDPALDDPYFESGKGPRVGIDEGHGNFHTLDGRYGPFARVLTADGYRVAAAQGEFTPESLGDVDILVVANALHQDNQQRWSLPTSSAFSPGEIRALVDWVEGGGSLFLIADHMPFPGAAADLAGALGVEFHNGFAMRGSRPDPPDLFSRDNGSLADHAVTRGRMRAERVETVGSFTGQAFPLPEDGEPLLTLVGEEWGQLLPEAAWVFTPETPREDIDGWCQGALLRRGQGRVAVFGEAAMFTSQTTGSEGRSMGMPLVEGNQRFLRNLMHWLAGDLDGF